MVMLDNSKIELYDILGLHFQTIIAIAKKQRLFMLSWRDIVIVEHNGISDIARKLNEEEIERAWSMII